MSSLDRLERVYANGNPRALWLAILHCARWQEVMPQWVSEAIDHAHIKNQLGMLGSFNDVFGRPNTRAQSAKIMRDHDHALAIADLAEKASKAGQSRNEEWFIEAGRAVGVSKTRAKELLNFARNELLRRGGK